MKFVSKSDQNKSDVLTTNQIENQELYRKPRTNFNQCQLGELVLECFDAMSNCLHSTMLDNHITAIGQALANPSLPINFQIPLIAIQKFLFYYNGKDKDKIILDSIDRPKDFSKEKAQALYLLNILQHPHYIYHGTIRKHLPSIHKNGLIAGKSSVWGGSDVQIAAHARSAVFFSSTWRIAYNWSIHTHLHSRGHKTGWSRTNVVIRLKAEGIDLISDQLAASQGNLMSQNSVIDASQAEVLIGLPTGLPVWHPISEAVKK